MELVILVIIIVATVGLQRSNTVQATRLHESQPHKGKPRPVPGSRKKHPMADDTFDDMLDFTDDVMGADLGFNVHHHAVGSLRGRGHGLLASSNHIGTFDFTRHDDLFGLSRDSDFAVGTGVDGFLSGSAFSSTDDTSLSASVFDHFDSGLHSSGTGFDAFDGACGIDTFGCGIGSGFDSFGSGFD